MSRELLELAERIEAASGPSYVLDCDIWDAIYPGERDERFAKLTAKGEPYHGRLGPADKDGYIKPLRAFTASIDSALSLVPEGISWRLDFARAQHGQHAIGSAFVIIDGQRYHGDAATPALALCAASLRAQAARSPE